MNFSQDRSVNKLIKEGWIPRGHGYGIVVKAYNNIGTIRKRAGYV